MGTRAWRAAVVVAVLAVSAWPAATAEAATVATTRVDIATNGAQGNDGTWGGSISADGRYVAFESAATNLVPGDTNGNMDVFVRDRSTSATSLVSIGTAGAKANNPSFGEAISGNGRYVAFTSWASNLVAGDTNDSLDVFVRDRQTNTTSRVSANTAGVQGNNNSYSPSISADGRYVAFASMATNLVTGDSNGAPDIFVRDLVARTTTRVSVGNTGGAQGNAASLGPSISADGRYVTFTSSASNLVAGDTNARQDVFIRDRTAATTSRISVRSGGTQGNGDSYTASVSTDGRYVAFISDATNLVAGDTNGASDVFLRDRTAGTTTRVSVNSGSVQGNAWSYNPPSVSTDGRYVAFLSDATNLVAGDTNGASDVFLRDLTAGTTTRVSLTSTGGQANQLSDTPAMTPDGRFVAFGSDASNLVPGDTNNQWDVFVRQLR